MDPVLGHQFKCWAAVNADDIMYHMFEQVCTLPSRTLAHGSAHSSSSSNSR